MAATQGSSAGPEVRPAQVTWAVRLLWAVLLVAVLTAIPQYLEPLPPEAGMSQWSLWILMAFVWAFWALLTFLVSRRHNWARIATLLFFIFNLAFWVWDYETMSDRPGYGLAFEFIDTVLTTVALYWLFTGPGAKWFRREPVANAL